jgi:transcriptional regulator with XRE-family HTH domain
MSELSKVAGDRIRFIRHEKGFSIEELAFRANISTTHLGHVERGDRSPTLDILGKLVTALDISFVELFSDFQIPRDENSTTLSILINRINSLNHNEQKELSIILDSLFRIIK